MNPKILTVIAVAAILGSSISLWFTMRPSSPKFSRELAMGIGEGVAATTAKVLNDQGRVVVVVADDYRKRGTPAAEQWTAFETELKKHRNITVAATEVVTLERMISGLGVSRQKLEELLAKHADAQALVLLVGLPPWEAQPPTNLTRKPPVVIAMASEIMSVQGFFDSGIVTVLITPRTESSADVPANPKTPREWFESHYLVTAAPR